ncbi:type III secretion system protein SsaM [Leclercia adecarboxylata]|nr:type III secretion system protein SsaM [Leclercia adecarboxylata]KMN61150.1 type III secretion system protein SsaM [Leclercia sp. LK8]
MEIDRVTELNILLFTQLAELPALPNADGIYCQGERFQTWLSWQDGRIHISQCMPLAPFDDNLLLLALQRWKPAEFFGIPQRIFQLSCGLAISCCPAVDSPAELWLQVHHRQQAFLESLCKSQ